MPESVLMPAPVKATMCSHSMIHRAIDSMRCSRSCTLVMTFAVKGLVVARTAYQTAYLGACGAPHKVCRLGGFDRIDAELVRKLGKVDHHVADLLPELGQLLGGRFLLCSSVNHWKCSTTSATSTLRAIARFFGEWNCSQSLSSMNALIASRRSSTKPSPTRSH